MNTLLILDLQRLDGGLIILILDLFFVEHSFCLLDYPVYIPPCQDFGVFFPLDLNWLISQMQFYHKLF